MAADLSGQTHLTGRSERREVDVGSITLRNRSSLKTYTNRWLAL